MVFSSLSFACVAFGLGLATADPALARHAASPLMNGWRIQNQEVLDDHPVTLLISMKQRNTEELHKIAQQVSDPRNSKYGRYLTWAQIQDLTRPSAKNVQIVRAWLTNAGAQVITRWNDEVLEARLNAVSAQVMLQTQFRHVVNDHTGQRMVLAGDYCLPADVDASVAAIYGLHGLPLPPRTSIRSKLPAAPANVTPSVLQKTYNITGVTAAGSAKNRQAVAEFQGQTFNASDLSAFFREYVAGAPQSAAKVSKFVGGGIGASQDESMLDVEYIMGIVPSILTEYWYWGGMDFCGDLKNWTGFIVSNDDAPLVHSVSYGYQGDLKDLGCNDAAVQDVDLNFAKLAAKGVSIIFASGDSGSGYPNHVCVNDLCGGGVNNTAVWGNVTFRFPLPPNINSPLGCCVTCQIFGDAGLCDAWTYDSFGVIGGLCTMQNNVRKVVSEHGRISGGNAVKPPPLKLYPSWPASSPWVTAVGSTRFQNQLVGQPEVATDLFGSGGGFSWLFDSFKDQSDAVTRYLAMAPQLPPANSFPPHGRATPDVSALGEGYQVILNGTVASIGGTSASTPAFAAMVSLLNEARLSAGKPSMGYLNPWLYQNPDLFTDVTEGDNAIGRGSFSIRYGFNCTKGWDPVTGLGTPRFDKMLRAALAPNAGVSEVLI